MADIFAAFDIVGLAGNVKAVYIAFGGITLLTVGYKWAKRATNRG